MTTVPKTSLTAFDRLCKFTEKYGSEDVKGLLKKAALFQFHEPPHKFLPKELSDQKAQWIMDNLYLPFPVVALEDTAGCTILIDRNHCKDCLTGKEHTCNLNFDIPRGGNHNRSFVEITLTDIDPSNFRNEDELRKYSVEVWNQKGGAVISSGDIRLTGIKDDILESEGKVDLSYCWDSITDKVITTPITAQEFIIKNVLASIQELVILCDPESFILQSKSDIVVKRENEGRVLTRIPRSTERPIYTILRPKEIRKTLGLPEQEHSITPHERRAHLRRLSADRYIHKKGQTILVKSCWIGPNEAKIGNKHYKVVLDH